MRPEVADILSKVEAGTMSENEAVAALVALGFAEADSKEVVFIAMGGSSLIEEGEDGKRYFVRGTERIEVGPDGRPMRK